MKSPDLPTAPDTTTAPVAARHPSVTTLHGEQRTDDYAWLRDREDPSVIAYLEAENAYTASMLAHTKPLQETLYAEILGRIKETDEQVPTLDGGWYYYSRTEQGKAYPIYARKRTLDGAEHIFFDQNEEAQGFEFYQLGGMEVSPNGDYLAVLVDTSGYEDFVLRVRDLRTNAWLGENVEKLSWGLAWASDNATLFFVSGDEAKRPDKVWRHRLGAPTDQDVLVYHEPDVGFNVGIERSRSGAFVFVHATSFTQAEWYAIDAANPADALMPFATRRPDVEYAIDHGADWFYILTNRDGATNFKVMRAPVTAPGEWEEFLSYRPAIFVEDIDVFRDWMVRTERREGLRRLTVRMFATGEEFEIPFPDAAYAVDLGANPEFATTTVRYTYQSLITSASVYDYDISARTAALLKQQEVLGGYDASRYAVERRMVTARDGVAVPVSLVYSADWDHTRPRPLLLYAYGSYGHTMEPSFNSARFSLIDRGFICAIAHVRGGQEMGRTWYDDGKMMKKLNTFTDFIDVARALIADGYTTADQLVAHGGSAGGLLMGAIANMSPQDFRAIVADVPFVDVINTMLDASIPLTAQEWEQWGNPAESDAYAYMRRYSPYDNVEQKDYPRMLVMSGINDSRVAYWEPAKWVARLRAMKTDSNPLLMHMLLGAGHGGSSGRYDRLKETAFRYAFMLDAVGRG